MTYKNAKNIAIFSIVALFTVTSFGLSNAYAEESEGYKMVGDVMPVLTFTFRDGIETHEFPVFKMGENFVDDSGVSFSVEGTVTQSPLLHKALDDAYIYRYSNAAFDHQFKYFDIYADFVKNGESIISLDYNNCRVDNYQVETLDSNDYESYTKEVGFAIVDKIDFVCSGVNSNNDSTPVTPGTLIDHGESGFKFINGMKTSVTFSFNEGQEKIEFPVFDLVSGYAESGRNVSAEFSVEGVLDYYPLLQSKIDNARKVSGYSGSSNDDFDALVEFTNGEKTLRGFDFSSCRVSDAKITTLTDKEEGFTGKSGFVTAYQLGFECSGIDALNMYYDELHGDGPSWKTTQITHEYVEPLQNTAKGLSAFTTFTFENGIETVEFSMFKQSEVLTATENTNTASGKNTAGTQQFTRKTTYPTVELRGIVGDYPLLYNHVDDNLSIQGVIGNNNRNLVDIDVKIVSGNEVIRGFNYSNCRSTDYVVSTNPNTEESYVKGTFALENIFDFECQGYHPNNPIYDAMFNVEKAKTTSSGDLRQTDDWAPGFYVE
ncbi:hypothetical protein [Nitrosopumilus ureiphilus]|uniref:Uncharacterized protein n=1 Tax=Nitrosopumilus ureiphilus TaxID=1470067 RepID=A0A7D5M3G7_9ARCH|nr:hypothetical protein [Nitrosopumilus ureiphilus]QLH06254.1 hypothetical protein C5F50_03555 [Nitrosopumilus ureiphilus]